MLLPLETTLTIALMGALCGTGVHDSSLELWRQQQEQHHYDITLRVLQVEGKDPQGQQLDSQHKPQHASNCGLPCYSACRPGVEMLGYSARVGEV